MSASQSFFIGGHCVGTVVDITHHAGFSRGTLVLDLGTYYPLIKRLVELAERVNTCPAEEYQEAWYLWHEQCREAVALKIGIGDNAMAIESFTIESDWLIEWEHIGDP